MAGKADAPPGRTGKERQAKYMQRLKATFAAAEAAIVDLSRIEDDLCFYSAEIQSCVRSVIARLKAAVGK